MKIWKKAARCSCQEGEWKKWRQLRAGASVHEAVVRDFFTPNVKAEVILDCLLTPQIAQIVNAKLGRPGADSGIEYVCKEMSLPYPGAGHSKAGAKVDYVLADAQYAYLTELKTTRSSQNKRQLSHYQAFSESPFGASLGRQLIEILTDTFGIRNFPPPATDEAFCQLFKKISGQEPGAGGNAELALCMIREGGWAQKPALRSRKYLLTLGEILDYLGQDNRTLWPKKLRLLYLCPETVDLDDEAEAPLQISLREAMLTLEKSRSSYARFLAAILRDIYG